VISTYLRASNPSGVSIKDVKPQVPQSVHYVSRYRQPNHAKDEAFGKYQFVVFYGSTVGFQLRHDAQKGAQAIFGIL